MGSNQRKDNMEHKLIGTGHGREIVPPDHCTRVLGTSTLGATGRDRGIREGKR